MPFLRGTCLVYKNAISTDVCSVRVWNSTYEARSNFIKFAKTESMFEIKKSKFFPRIYVY